MKRILITVALCLAPAVASARGDGAVIFSAQDAHKLNEVGKHNKSEAKKRLKTLSNEDIQASLTENLTDKTKIIFQKGYGVYVEYSGPDGSDRMWFQGNRGVVKGVWGVRDTWGKPQACFHYFNSRNYVTGEFNSTECIATEDTLGNTDVIDERSGDVFNLMSDKIPYVKSAMDVPEWPSTDAAQTTPAPSGH